MCVRRKYTRVKQVMTAEQEKRWCSSFAKYMQLVLPPSDTCQTYKHVVGNFAFLYDEQTRNMIGFGHVAGDKQQAAGYRHVLLRITLLLRRTETLWKPLDVERLANVMAFSALKQVSRHKESLTRYVYARRRRSALHDYPQILSGLANCIDVCFVLLPILS